MSKSYLNSTLWLSKPRTVCGIMTGTSVDGIDVAVSEFCKVHRGKHKFRLLFANTLPFDKKIKSLIFRVISDKISISDVAELRILIAYAYYDAILALCKENAFDIANIDAVGVHGQTVWHKPNGRVPTTLQLCSISTLANLIGKPVVGDFRSADVALGGEGAPLVPIFDYNFLRKSNENIVALNIGGIANITYIPKRAKISEVIAFDTGPGNVLIDGFMKKLFGRDYDADGEVARRAPINTLLLHKLLEHPFIKRDYPKSTGREEFNIEFIQSCIKELGVKRLKKSEIISTLTAFTAISIAEQIFRLCGDSPVTIIVSGGGAKNKTLLLLLESYIASFDKAKTCKRIILSDEIGIPADYKEAICFAYLAYRTLGGLHSNIPNISGASREAILGVIAFPN